MDKLPDELLDMGHSDCSICEEARSHLPHSAVPRPDAPCPSCAALRARIALLEKVAKEVPFLLSVIASGEKLSDEEIYYQQEQLRAYNAALAEGKEGT